MSVLLLVIAATSLAMLLLVLYSTYLFEENRTRIPRQPDSERNRDERHAAIEGELMWRTLVDPVEAENRAQASKPFAAAYARAMTAAYDDARAA